MPVSIRFPALSGCSADSHGGDNKRCRRSALEWALSGLDAPRFACILSPVVPRENRRKEFLLAELKRLLSAKPEVRLALLFGSRARGTSRPDSDVDIAVDAPGLEPLDLAAELSLALHLDVQVVPLREAGYPLLNALLKESEVIHEGTPDAATQWRIRTILTCDLDRPLYEKAYSAFIQHVAKHGLGHG